MKKDSWIKSYAKLAFEHKWGGVINTFLACMGFCYLGNFISDEVLQAGPVFGTLTQQAIVIALLTAVHSVFVPSLAGVDK